MLAIDAAQLRFSIEEVEEFVGPILGDDTLAARVYELTEGWPAAVRLAVESLRPLPPERRSAALAQAARPGGSLFGYLTQEVLREEPREVAELLKALAPLDGFTYALCSHLGFADAEAQLEALAHRGLFLDAHGGEGGWMRRCETRPAPSTSRRCGPSRARRPTRKVPPAASRGSSTSTRTTRRRIWRSSGRSSPPAGTARRGAGTWATRAG